MFFWVLHAGVIYLLLLYRIRRLLHLYTDIFTLHSGCDSGVTVVIESFGRIATAHIIRAYIYIAGPNRIVVN